MRGREMMMIPVAKGEVRRDVIGQAEAEVVLSGWEAAEGGRGRVVVRGEINTSKQSQLQWDMQVPPSYAQRRKKKSTNAERKER